MPQADTRILEQRVLALALLNKESCGFDGTRIPESCTCAEHDCPCHSIGFQEVHGQVAEFPMLREPCPSGQFTCSGGRLWKSNNESRLVLTNEPHKLCGGRGWLPVTTTDALLEAGKPYHFQIWWDGSLWRVYSHMFRKGESEGPNYSAGELREAVAAALEAATGLTQGSLLPGVTPER